MLSILYPYSGAFIRWKEKVLITFQGTDVRGPICYVLANDGLWYRQAPAHHFLDSSHLYIAPCVFGFQEHRAGWSYEVAAVTSHGKLPDVFEDIPHDLTQSNRVYVTRNRGK